MKKKLVLLSVRANIAAMYLHDLKELFHGYLETESFSTEQEQQCENDREILSQADILLVTSPECFPRARPFVSERCKVVRMESAFLEEKINALRQLPSGTNALVCFAHYSISIQVVSTLYELGFKNLNLDSYNSAEGLPPGKRYDVAIIGDNSAIVPDEILSVINLGMRKLSFSTLLSIANTADILDDRLENRFYSYCKHLFTPSDFVKNVYGSSLMSRIQLQTIMNCIDYAILICDANYCILEHNRNVCSMFHTNLVLAGTQLSDLPSLHKIFRLITTRDNLENELVALKNGKSVLLSKEQIKAGENELVHLLLIKDVTKIQSLENSFKCQLAQRGHVTKYCFQDIRGDSAAIRNCIDKAKKITEMNKPVLVIGESGTGKELFAQSLHTQSPRAPYPFIALNCAALPTTLLESELFGHTEGAFTGAKKGGRTGLFEMANLGTLFLDEISEISLETQAKLLRVLEEKEIMRIGSSEIVPVDVRIIAATNQNLHELVQQGKFRLDLYYRLNTLILRIPPLRDRLEDIPVLIHHILNTEQLDNVTIAPEVMEFFSRYSWQGNVRELRNCVEYMVHISDGNVQVSHLPDYIQPERYGLAEAHETYKEDALQRLDKRDLDLVSAIVTLLFRMPFGRRTLLHELRQSQPDLSEYRLRAILTFLIEQGFVCSGKGRAGMVLTPKGRLAAQID